MQTAACAVVRLPRAAQEPLAHPSQGFTDVGLAVAGGCEERWVELDPYAGSALSALKIARKIVAVGGTPLALTDCLNFGSPTNPFVMRQISDAVDGITLVAKELKIPVVSGNVSLNNQTDGEPIPPTPMIGMVGRVASVANLPLAALPSGSVQEVTLVRVSLPDSVARSSFACSQVAWILGGENGGPVPQLDLKAESQLWDGLKAILEKFKPVLSIPVGHGGTFFTAAQAALQSNSALQFAPEFLAVKATAAFSEGNMGFVLGFLSLQVSIAVLAEVVAKYGLVLDPVGALKPGESENSKTESALLAPVGNWQKASQDGLGRFFATRFAEALQ